MDTFHHPKGSMCLTCKHVAENCSKLPFSTMFVIERYEDGRFAEVRCAKFKRQTH